MQTVRLGHSDLELYRLGLGCMSMTGTYGEADEHEAIATLELALTLGVNFLDTADMYGAGRNEQLLAKVLEHRREEVVLATKGGILHDAEGRNIGVNGTPEYLKKACDASLKRLGVEHVELYYLHRMDPNVPIEESVGGLAELVKAGKILHIGLSEVSPETLRRAHAVHPISALQSEYSLWTREPENGVLETCRELGITFVPFSPLGRGLLAGGLKRPQDLQEGDLRRSMPRFQNENFAHNQAQVEALRTLGKQLGASPAQLAIAWVLSRGEDIVPIPGTKRRDRLRENLGALELRLDAATLAKLEEIASPKTVAGARYPEHLMRSVGK